MSVLISTKSLNNYKEPKKMTTRRVLLMSLEYSYHYNGVHVCTNGYNNTGELKNND